MLTTAAALRFQKPKSPICSVLEELVEVFQELGKVFQELFDFSKMSFQVMKSAICVFLDVRLGTC